MLLELGQLAKAKHAIERAIELRPKVPGHYYALSQIARFAAADPWLTAMEDLAREPLSVPTNARLKLHFGLGKAYADVGRHQMSFDHYLVGKCAQAPGNRL